MYGKFLVFAILGLFALAGVAYVAFLLWFRRKIIPGIPVVSVSELSAANKKFGIAHLGMFDLLKKHNGIFQSRFLFSNFVYTCKPEYVRSLLTNVTAKGWTYDLTRFYPGESGIFSADTDDNKKHRPPFTASFSNTALNYHGTDYIQQQSEILCDRLRQRINKSEFEMDPLFSALTVDVISKVAFGYDIQALDDSVEYLSLVESMKGYLTGQRIRSSFPLTKYIYKIKQLLSMIGIKLKLSDREKGFGNWIQSRIKLESFCKHLYQHMIGIGEENEVKSDGKAAPPRILDGILKLRGQMDDIGFNERHLLSDIISFFLAGHDTSAHTLSFIFFLLAANPDVQRRAQNAVDDVYGKASQSKTDLKTIPDYVDAIIKEAMRRYPTAASGSARRVVDSNGFDLGPYHLIPDTWIRTPFYSTHNWAETWGEDVLEFKPERWLQVESSSIHPVGSNLGAYSGTGMKKDNSDLCFCPFSTGPRNCIGMNLAIMEMRVVVTDLLRRFEFTLPAKIKEEIMTNGVFDDSKVVEDVFTLRLNKTIRLVVAERA